MLNSCKHETAYYIPRFSALWTGLCGLVFLSGLGLLIWAASHVSPFARFPAPDRALSLVVSQMLDLEAALTRLPTWEREVYRFFSGEKSRAADMIRCYEQLTSYAASPRVLFEMAVLYGETGQGERLDRMIRDWDYRPPPFPVWKRMLNIGYLGHPASRSEVLRWQAYLAETVPNNWFYTQLARRLGDRVGDRAFLATVEQDARERTDRLMWRARALVRFECLAIGLGVVGMAYLGLRWLRRGPAGLVVVSTLSLPPGWSFRDGIAVLVRGGAITALLLLALFALPVNPEVLQFLSLFAMHLPVLGLVWWYLLRPRGISGIQQFGLWTRPGTGTILAMSVCVIVALNLVGGWAIGLAADTIGRTIHWTDWFEPHFAWGDVLDVGVVMFEYVVLAAVFEELVFRGIVFSTCRCVLSWVPSAMISAALFAAAHGYSLVGFFTVFWSGVLWAWAYEKTGSLWVGILGHSLNNLLFSLVLLAFLR